ncbi:MAG: class I SAM-dependent methyltransferase [Candidatus Latescibacteria bacterium]|nr:class I SAM-dependent methyltransferase [Candidatus Latescibacterota bacterium]
MGKFLKYIAPKSFLDGLERCNSLGKKTIACSNIERFLDIGCGDGKLTMEFSGIANPNEIHGIEFVDTLRQEAEKRGIRCTGFDLNGKWDYEDNFFDLILSSQNIEHLHNTRLYLEECHRCLKPGGQLIVLTENLASWINIFALLFGWQPFSTTNINGWSIGNPLIWHADESRDEGFMDTWQKSGVSGTVGHVRVLSYTGLNDLLIKVGFKQVRLNTRGYLPLWGKLSDILCSIDKRHGHFLIASGVK